MLSIKNILIICALISFVSSESVKFQSCPGDEGKCLIKDVRINPCPESPLNKPCIMKRGKTADIEFDYVPDFDADSLEGNVYWATEIDMPLMGMDTDACKYTTCPVVKGNEQTYKYSLSITKKFPINKYDIKWVLSTKDNKQCCFITEIELKR